MHPSLTHGAFSWPELMTTDPDAAVGFYNSVVGWNDRVMPMPQGDYHLQMLGELPVAGIMSLPHPDIPTTWVVYITVDDVDVAAARAVELGGKIEVPARDIPTVGRFCGLSDPQGAFFHVITYEPSSEDMPDVDFAKAFVTHGAFSWFHLQTKDPVAATSFYSKLLGWDVIEEQMPYGPYRTIKVDTVGMGGIVELNQPGVPPNWTAYVTVDDADAAASAASSAGGTIVVPPTDIPSVGRSTTIQDPTGGILNVIKYAPMGE